MKRLLLTGATGFVGRNALLHSLQDNHYETIVVPVRSRVKLMQQLKTEGYSSLPSKLRIIETSAPEWSLDGLEVDHLIHCAGVIFARTKEEYFDINTFGTLELLKHFKSPTRILILSSQSASGPCGDDAPIKDESHPDSPLTWYGESKLEMEKQVKKQFSHLDVIFLRPPMIFGPRDHATLPLFKMAYKPLQVKSGLSKKYYSFVSVADLVDAMFTALFLPDWEKVSHQHFFVCAQDPMSDVDLIRQATHACHKNSRIVRIPQWMIKGVSKVVDSIPTWRATIPSLSVDRAKEIWPDRWVASPKAFEEKFSWKAKDDLPSSLQQTFQWYVSDGQLP